MAPFCHFNTPLSILKDAFLLAECEYSSEKILVQKNWIELYQDFDPAIPASKASTLKADILRC